MEENKPQTGKFALNYGLVLGGLSIVFALMLYSLDMHYQGGMLVLGVSVILMIAVIILGMLQFKKANSGFMTLGQGLKVGLGIAIVGGVIGILFNQVMAGVIDPEMMDKAMEYQKGVLMETTKLTPDQIDAQMEMGKKFSTPSMQIVFGLVYSLVAGFILSLIPALILKKQETNQ
ncbi:MAG: DNA-binding transcriptional regulator of glucitol operon [Psychroserpens sp.]|jgi:DNA-binding transcriptional regulator of glucitol operon